MVNCAAYTAVDKAETERETARTINALAPRWIARYAKEKGAGIIHISTDYVFGGNANTPLAPDMPTAPSSVYGATKLEGEKLVAEANPRHLIIRTSWLYSRYGNNFVKTMLRLAAGRNCHGLDDQVELHHRSAGLLKIVFTHNIRSLFLRIQIWSPQLDDFARHLYFCRQEY